MSLLSVKNLSIGYNQILQRNLNFDIQNNEMFILKGENGTGKSTLVKTLLGQIPAKEGQIKFKIPKKQIVYFPQYLSYELPLSLTLGELLNSFNCQINYEQIVSDKFLETKWVHASGGEKQKALILANINSNTKMLFLDEPFNHLDQTNVEKLSSFFESLILNNTIQSIFMITHIIPKLKTQVKLKQLDIK